MTTVADATHQSWVLRALVNRNRASPRKTNPIAVFGFIVIEPGRKVVSDSIFHNQPSNTRAPRVSSTTPPVRAAIRYTLYRSWLIALSCKQLLVGANQLQAGSAARQNSGIATSSRRGAHTARS